MRQVMSRLQERAVHHHGISACLLVALLLAAEWGHAGVKPLLSMGEQFAAWGTVLILACVFRAKRRLEAMPWSLRIAVFVSFVFALVRLSDLVAASPMVMAVAFLAGLVSLVWGYRPPSS